MEIKDDMTADFMRNADVARTYGFETGDAFSDHFSRVSIESLLFYIAACATWTLENLFDRHKSDVEERIEAMLPHRPKWYRDKALAFMKDKTLVADTDEYDTTDMTEADIEAAQVVKHAVAVESADASLLTVKIAGEEGGVRCPLDTDTEEQIKVYLAEIKDAGVHISLVNQTADVFHCEVDIYYDALLLSENVEAACREVIVSYIENLPFNGEYTNMALVDELQKVEGVRIVEMGSATAEVGGESTPTKIEARYVPAEGYFSAGNISLKLISYQS